ncbi:MAG: 16S rRNA (adenine(1518)-N(6)/adenine(1519)-N(6))-dimethyltransferase RsmA [Gemmatimonadota bacterium]|nr:16S rRNA (adenine(1518)-N(6)/adenine(1519)-N(6))-dimethyltransferase RsmA [Gemmatimonadota bacterium]
MIAPGGGAGRMPPIRKSLGQHFLSDVRILGRIADAIQIVPGETVIEIGPGRGALTEALRTRGARVIAVEVDRMLSEMLAKRYAGDDAVRIVQGDALETDFAELAGGAYALVGNVPYYITTPLIFHALERPRASRSVFLVQREVATRMASPPGVKEYGALSVNVQSVARVELLFAVPAASFHPPPKVESAVVRLTPLAEPMVAPEREARVRSFVQEIFGLRRKQMRRVLRTVAKLDVDAANAILATCEIDPEARPETLAPAQFTRLSAALD